MPVAVEEIVPGTKVWVCPDAESDRCVQVRVTSTLFDWGARGPGFLGKARRNGKDQPYRLADTVAAAEVEEEDRWSLLTPATDTTGEVTEQTGTGVAALLVALRTAIEAGATRGRWALTSQAGQRRPTSS